MFARGAVHFPGIFNYIKDNLKIENSILSLKNDELIQEDDLPVNDYEEIDDEIIINNKNKNKKSKDNTDYDNTNNSKLNNYVKNKVNEENKINTEIEENKSYKIDSFTNPDPDKLLNKKLINDNSNDHYFENNKENVDKSNKKLKNNVYDEKSDVVASQKLSKIMSLKHKNNEINIIDYIKEFLEYAIKYENYFHNSKYNILYILKTHNTKSSLFKDISSCKDYEKMKEIVNNYKGSN